MIIMPMFIRLNPPAKLLTAPTVALVLLSFLARSPVIHAADTPLTEAERKTLVTRLAADTKTVSVLRLKFTQTTTSSLLKAPEVSQGTLLFQRPMNFRYEYENGNIFSLDRGTFTYLLAKQKQAGRLDLRRYERQLAKYADPMGMLGKIGGEYELAEAVRGAQGVRLALVPGAKRKRGPVKRIHFLITETPAGQPLTVSGVEVELKGGDRLAWAFSKPEYNPPLQPGAFSVKIPAGVAVREALPDGALNF